MRLFAAKNKSFYICEATLHDAHKLAALHKASFPKSWDSISIVSLLNQKTMHCILAYVEGSGTDNPVGFALFRIVGDEAEVITICTNPDHRGTGIGRQLMTELILKVHTARATRLYLEVSEKNEAAINLYKSLGMKKVGTRKGYYQEGEMAKRGNLAEAANALVMELNLG